LGKLDSRCDETYAEQVRGAVVHRFCRRGADYDPAIDAARTKAAPILPNEEESRFERTFSARRRTSMSALTPEA
jgi:hypothetical protein